jgi:hypothetical protein
MDIGSILIVSVTLIRPHQNCLEELKIFRGGYHQQKTLRKNYVSSYPFFRSKRKFELAQSSGAVVWRVDPEGRRQKLEEIKPGWSVRKKRKNRR